MRAANAGSDRVVAALLAKAVTVSPAAETALCTATGTQETGAAVIALQGRHRGALAQLGGLRGHHEAVVALLTACSLDAIGAAVGCPLYHAVHLRNIPALRHMAAAAKPADVWACLGTRDTQGEAALHNAARGKAAGLARVVRAAQALAGAVAADFAEYLGLDTAALARAVAGASEQGQAGRQSDQDVSQDAVDDTGDAFPPSLRGAAMEAAAMDADLRIVVEALIRARAAGPAAAAAAGLTADMSVVDIPTHSGDTALGLAAQTGRPASTLAWLVERGARVNARNHLGRTPLHLAAAAGRAPQVRALLEAGAAVTVSDADGRTPAACARLVGYFAMAVALEAAEAAETALQQKSDNRLAVTVAFDTALATPGATLAPATRESERGRDCGIAVVDARELTAAAFYREYVSLLRPVLLRGALELAGDGAAPLTWTALAQRFGSLEVTVGAVPYEDVYGRGEKRTASGNASSSPRRMRLDAFLTQHLHLTRNDAVPPTANSTHTATVNRGSTTAADPPLYVFDAQVLARTPALARALPPPTALVGDRFVLQQFMAGPTGSGAAPHFHGHAVNLLAQGRKRWELLPPGDAFFRFTTAAQHFGMPAAGERRVHAATRTCVQEAGDALYVPAGWGHAVLNEAPSLAAAYEFSAMVVE